MGLFSRSPNYVNPAVWPWPIGLQVDMTHELNRNLKYFEIPCNKAPGERAWSYNLVDPFPGEFHDQFGFISGLAGGVNQVEACPQDLSYQTPGSATNCIVWHASESTFLRSETGDFTITALFYVARWRVGVGGWPFVFKKADASTGVQIYFNNDSGQLKVLINNTLVVAVSRTPTVGHFYRMECRRNNSYFYLRFYDMTTNPNELAWAESVYVAPPVMTNTVSYGLDVFKAGDNVPTDLAIPGVYCKFWDRYLSDDELMRDKFEPYSGLFRAYNMDFIDSSVWNFNRSRIVNAGSVGFSRGQSVNVGA